MKQVYLFCTLFFIGCAAQNNTTKTIEPKAYSPNQIWEQLESDRYKTLHTTQISYNKLFKDDQDKISQDAKRTLQTHNDLLEPFEKLAHPNGICLKGIWSIDKPNIYGGYFKQGSKAIFIGRASSALSNTKSGSIRALGFAGKIFDTTDPNRVSKNNSANFFLIDNFGGTDIKYYKDTVLFNQPFLSINSSFFKNFRYSLKVASSFNNSDKHSTIRQLYKISYLDNNNITKDIITPKWLKLELANKKDIKVYEGIDFRDELSLKDGEKLIFSIYLSSLKKDNQIVWKKIGKIIIDQTVVSKSCDQRLHFHHPKFRDDIRYK